jgi:adenosine deaminase
VIRDRIHSWPKAELHCHLDGSVRLATLLDIARKEGKLEILPFHDEEPLQQELESVDRSDSLEAYLAWFRYSLPMLQSKTAITRAVYELAEDNARENVRYLEIRYCPLLHIDEGLTPEQVNDAIVDGLKAAERAFNICVRLIVSAVRDQDPAASLQMAKLAVQDKDRNVVGFDLASNETGHPARDHKSAFDYARHHLLNITAHAGESCGPDSIHQAIVLCGAHRIGHGTSLIRDPALLQYVRDRQILLEVCPTSNVQTGVVSSYAGHPLKSLIDYGIPVSIGTDNRLFSRTSVTEELNRVYERCGVSIEELKEIVLNGFRYAFLPYDDRQVMVGMVEAELEG